MMNADTLILSLVLLPRLVGRAKVVVGRIGGNRGGESTALVGRQ